MSNSAEGSSPPVVDVGSTAEPTAAPKSATEWGRQGLSRNGRRVAYAALEAFLTELDGRGRYVAPQPELCRRVLDEYGLLIGAGSPMMRIAIHGMYRTLEWLPLLVARLPRRFSRLTLHQRVQVLETLENSETGLLAMMLVAIKVPLLLGAYEKGEALRSTGYDRSSTTSRRKPEVAR